MQTETTLKTRAQEARQAHYETLLELNRALRRVRRAREACLAKRDAKSNDEYNEACKVLDAAADKEWNALNEMNSVLAALSEYRRRDRDKREGSRR